MNHCINVVECRNGFTTNIISQSSNIQMSRSSVVDVVRVVEKEGFLVRNLNSKDSNFQFYLFYSLHRLHLLHRPMYLCFNREDWSLCSKGFTTHDYIPKTTKWGEQ